MRVQILLRCALKFVTLCRPWLSHFLPWLVRVKWLFSVRQENPGSGRGGEPWAGGGGGSGSRRKRWRRSRWGRRKRRRRLSRSLPTAHPRYVHAPMLGIRLACSMFDCVSLFSLSVPCMTSSLIPTLLIPQLCEVKCSASCVSAAPLPVFSPQQSITSYGSGLHSLNWNNHNNRTPTRIS